MLTVPQNSLGLTHACSWSDLQDGGTLHDNLKKQGVEYTEAEIPHLVASGGCCSLVFYASPKNGQPVTVLCVPIHYDADAFAEDYYYFVGKSREVALQDERWWIDNWDKIKRLTAK